jgi:hypothetical protein
MQRNLAKRFFVQLLLHHPVNDPSYRPPDNAQQVGRAAFVHDLSHVGGQLLERQGKAAGAACPGNLLHFHCESLAIDSPRRIGLPQSRCIDRQELPTSPCQAIIACSTRAATAAAGFIPTRAHLLPRHPVRLTGPVQTVP